METRRMFFIDNISTNQVQLRRVPGRSASPDADDGIAMHQITITTGDGSATNATTTFWQTGCHFYEVIVRRMS